MTKPYVLVCAGHRSPNDGGNPEEQAMTPDLARSYKAAFRAAGYQCDWLQEVDGDADPDDTLYSLDAVGRAAARVIGQHPGECVMLDLHYEGSPRAGVFAIVPDEQGLRTAIAGGAPGYDVWANNPLDQKLAGLISKNIAKSTGLQLRTGIKQPGIMSERETGVAGQYGARLAMFAYTVQYQSRCIRLVVEHGNHGIQPDRSIIFQPDFTDKCAAASVAAVDSIYASEAPPPPPKYAKPRPIKTKETFFHAADKTWIKLPTPLKVSGTAPVTPRLYATPTEQATGEAITSCEVNFVCASTIGGGKNDLWGVVSAGAPVGSRVMLAGFAKGEF